MQDEVLREISIENRHKVVYVHFEPPREPELGGPVEKTVSDSYLLEALKKRGIANLYKFQEEAINAIRNGKNTLIISGTGTGKTEAFLIPIIEDLLKEPSARAVLVYPTKALARDQVERIQYYTSAVFGFRVGVYDGDTPERERENLQAYPPKILITNPDMLHISLRKAGFLQEFLQDTKYIVLDDAHIYSGVFGAHVYYILRRLKRIVKNEPVLVASSATIGNPQEFAEKILGENYTIVIAGATRRAPIYHVMLRPVLRSKLAESIYLLQLLSSRKLKTLLFVDSHKVAESVSLLAKQAGVKVEVHRAGLLPEHRKRVEEKLKKGEIDAVVATPTLELGIDIGELDAVIMHNIPPTYSKYLQRAGRVGRRGKTGYVFLILGDDPISSYYERNPQEFYTQVSDPVFLDPANEEVIHVHLVAMSLDSPFKLEELTTFEREVLKKMEEEGYLKKDNNGYYHATLKGLRFLRSRENIRGVGEQLKIVTDTGKVLGYREYPQAIKELFPGAIYLHAGTPYISLGIKKGKAVVKLLPVKMPPVTTSPLYYTYPYDGKVYLEREVMGIHVRYLELTIEDHVYGYVTKTFPEGQVVSQKLLEDELTYSFKTKGILLEFPPKQEWTDIQNAEAFHAIEHALIFAGQMIVGASQTDMGGISFPTGQIYIYDSFPGGSGVTKQLFYKLEEALKRAYNIVSKCNCEDGCPRCIYSPYCGNNNQMLSRRKAESVLKEVLSLKILRKPVQRTGRPIV
ncbi:DEAD/DEAH box helicase [Thermofilum sp.]|jgi:DEAD/DEAH box helicase domain-containing protein|uniref:DEAD/DEAH box helicase n=3 Tax=Thermofilum sp. TaxID=1961369 RepID=UPI00258D0BBE|nr:DEAD/DEAH box helicase [Thermofilum sp.]